MTISIVNLIVYRTNARVDFDRIVLLFDVLCTGLLNRPCKKNDNRHYSVSIVWQTIGYLMTIIKKMN